MDEAGYRTQNRLIPGEHYVYPGHPIMIGLMIMETYPCLDAALEKTVQGRPDALSNPSIPGSGEAVYSALYLLRDARDGIRTVSESVDMARLRWTSDNLPRDVELGQDQADRLTDAYTTRMQEWLELSTALVPTP